MWLVTRHQYGISALVFYLVVNYALNRLELVIYWWLSLGPEPKPEFKGDERTFRLWLDTNQYQQDMAETVHGSEASWILANCVVPFKTN